MCKNGCGPKFFASATCAIIYLAPPHPSYTYVLITIGQSLHLKVLLIVLAWLFEVLKDIPPENWPEIVLANDAMCKLDGMKVCNKPLPLPEPFIEMWMKVTKVLHETTIIIPSLLL